jgi:predicted nucleic acid-binding Zn ribbon protein
MGEEPVMGKMYRYECESCGYHDEVEDVVVDAFFFSQNCKRGTYPAITCPECNGTMKHKAFKSPPGGR